jgi:hypothetical protein
MLNRFKQAVVDSFIGAIALGYVLAQVILLFVNIFASPVAGWVSRKQYGGLMPHTATLPGFSLQDACNNARKLTVSVLIAGTRRPDERNSKLDLLRNRFWSVPSFRAQSDASSRPAF